MVLIPNSWFAALRCRFRLDWPARYSAGVVNSMGRNQRGLADRHRKRADHQRRLSSGEVHFIDRALARNGSRDGGAVGTFRRHAERVGAIRQITSATVLAIPDKVV